MANVIAGPTVNGFTIYNVEPTAWASPQVLTFDNRGQMSVPEDKRIDVVILGDGFLVEDQGAFEAYVSDWYDRFSLLWPYSEFISAFRVRAAFVASMARATPNGGTYFGVTIKTNDKLHVGGETQFDPDFIEKFYDALEAISSAVRLNTQIYPEELQLGWSGDMPSSISDHPLARDSTYHSRVASNLIVVMAIYSDPDSKVSGWSRPVEASAGHELEGMKVVVAVGENALHEFTHAFATVVDECIPSGGRGRFPEKSYQDTSRPSVFELFNVTFTGVGDQVPWRHLAWDGLAPRSSDSWVGQMWIGGKVGPGGGKGGERGVWHAEYKCLMNGRHGNYLYRTDENLPDPYSLRTGARLCLWCEEIVTVRILEKTGAFSRVGDPDEINELGRLWYWRWVDELRTNYWRQFDLNTRISDREAWYHDPANLEEPGVWDGNLEATNLMREITTRPHPGVSYAALLFS